MIPITYAELLLTLLKEQLVYTKAPLPVPARLPAVTPRFPNIKIS